MNLPRWTVYPALGVLAGFALLAVPEPPREDPHAGAARRAVSSVPARETTYPELVVLGIDGMDPDLLAEVIRLYPERMPNFRKLIADGDGIHSLGTSTPPQSPVAWSNFITGLNPGGHGVYDFIHRDPMTRGPAASTTTPTGPKYTWLPDAIPLPGGWQVPLPSAGGDASRSGKSFWGMLMDAGIPADIWRMPANFPVEPAQGLSFPGMMTPALDSAYGEASFFTTDPVKSTALTKSKDSRVTLITERGGVIATSLRGPENMFRRPEPGTKDYARAELVVHVDRDANAALFELGEERVILQPGQWSEFVPVTFDLVSLLMQSQNGICRFYLRSLEPEVEFYVSPVNYDPEAPLAPVSAPDDASANLAGAIGPYYTQGMAEDVGALKKQMISDEEFMAQAELVYRERREMMDVAIDEYLDGGEGGFLFFYYSTVDLCSHMMWRHFDSTHPHHDAEIAERDSSHWSGREGSTWRDTVHDLYLKMDPVLGHIRERLGEHVPIMVMSDHGFAPYRRKFSLNTWLYEEGYLVLHDGKDKELPKDDPAHAKVEVYYPGVVDWSKTRAYGMGFNGLYLNLAGRERDNPKTPEDESGIVQASEAEALLREIKAKLEAIDDPATGMKPVLRCDLATDVYAGARLKDAPDLLVGYNAGYGNDDQASIGRILHDVLADNTGGQFNGSHLMAPDVVAGILISNQPVREGEHRLEDLTVEILERYGVARTPEMKGHPVLVRPSN